MKQSCAILCTSSYQLPETLNAKYVQKKNSSSIEHGEFCGIKNVPVKEKSPWLKRLSQHSTRRTPLCWQAKWMQALQTILGLIDTLFAFEIYACRVWIHGVQEMHDTGDSKANASVLLKVQIGLMSRRAAWRQQIALENLCAFFNYLLSLHCRDVARSSCVHVILVRYDNQLAPVCVVWPQYFFHWVATTFIRTRNANIGGDDSRWLGGQNVVLVHPESTQSSIVTQIHAPVLYHKLEIYLPCASVRFTCVSWACTGYYRFHLTTNVSRQQQSIFNGIRGALLRIITIV